ncbi:MAG: hypothetical protein KF713_18795 [Turneriella sp.]|nr:hypothetical protein [Turneriella sp.]
MPNSNIESFITQVKAQASADAEILAVAAAGSAIRPNSAAKTAALKYLEQIGEKP